MLLQVWVRLAFCQLGTLEFVPMFPIVSLADRGAVVRHEASRTPWKRFLAGGRHFSTLGAGVSIGHARNGGVEVPEEV